MWPFKKHAKSVKRSFDAAQISRLTSSWTTQSLTSDETLKRNLKTLRARSREQSEHNDYAKRFVSLVRNNVIGPDGIRLQARTVRTDTGKQDFPANQAIEKTWSDWGKSCDVTGKLSWVEAQKLAMSSLAIDGEVLIRKVIGRDGGRYNFALQFIDSELLDVEHHDTLKGGNYIRMGIEFNKFARPVAYWIKQAAESYDNYSKYTRIPADEMIHAFVPERVGQKRGLPWMSTSLMRMQMLNGYEEAALVNARAGAGKMGFFIDSTGAGYEGDDVDSSGNYIEESEPGTFNKLPANIDFKEYDPQYPHGELPNFIKSALRGIASGLCVSYNALANDLEGVNFSSIRAGVLEDREHWKGLQIFAIDTICRPLYESWLSVQLAFGGIKINQTPLRIDLEDKYRDVRWQAKRWSWVDPQKDVNAKVTEHENNMISLGGIIREQGRDPDEVWSEIESENARLKELGINKEVVQNEKII